MRYFKCPCPDELAGKFSVSKKTNQKISLVYIQLLSIAFWSEKGGKRIGTATITTASLGKMAFLTRKETRLALARLCAVEYITMTRASKYKNKGYEITMIEITKKRAIKGPSLFSDTLEKGPSKTIQPMEDNTFNELAFSDIQANGDLKKGHHLPVDKKDKGPTKGHTYMHKNNNNVATNKNINVFMANPETDSPGPVDLTLTNDKPKKPREKKPKAPSKSGALWAAYVEAYKLRYGTEPLRSARESKAACEIIDTLPSESDAISLVQFYLQIENKYYLSKFHTLSCCLFNLAEIVMTQKKYAPKGNHNNESSSIYFQ